MKETDMDIDWRTVQFFIDEEGEVAEVQIDNYNHKKIRCTCGLFSKAARCKHTKFVKGRMEDNDGHYAIMVPVDVDEEIAIEAMSSSESFRKFILMYGKVELI